MRLSRAILICCAFALGIESQKLTFEDGALWTESDSIGSEDFQAVIRSQNEVVSFEKDIKQYIRKLSLPLLRQILRQGDTLRPDQSDKIDSMIAKNNLTCDACAVAVTAVQEIHKLNVLTEDEILTIAVAVCKIAKIEDDRVCELAVKQFKDEVLFVVFNLKPDELCYWLLKDTCDKPSGFMPDWTVTIAPPMEDVTIERGGTGGTLKALYFTDIHVDFRYMVGSTATCDEPLCCRNNDGVAQNVSDGAWKYGDYRNCDMPSWTFESMLKKHSKSDIDFILFTGDIPAHDVWNQTSDDQIDKINKFTKTVLKYFPNTPLFAAMGNHESSPVNSYPPPQVYNEPGGNIQWLFDAYSNNWSHWLPDEALQTVKKGGFYTTVIKPGFRVVSLNDNFGSDDDWWLMVDDYSVDPHGQVQWFSDVMDKAEKAAEKVLIITHRPTHGLLSSWQRNYYSIINRYQGIIIAQLFGHAHSDELRLYYDISDPTHVASMAFIGPGFTTYSYLNTGHRVYEFDSASFDIVDATTYFMDINEANMNASPDWEVEYSFRNDYGMTSLKPDGWKNLVDRFEKNETLFQNYKDHVSKNKDKSNCDGSCKQSTICSIRNNVQDLNIPC